MLTCRLFCRDEATRTPDPYVPNVVRYQLRYIPMHFLLFAVSDKPKSHAKVHHFLQTATKNHVYLFSSIWPFHLETIHVVKKQSSVGFVWGKMTNQTLVRSCLPT